MFVLRCAFWLSIVYWSMSWTSVPFQSASASRSVVDAAQRVAKADEIVRRVGDFCLRHAADCAADADLATSLFASDRMKRPQEARDETRPGAPQGDVPLPVPDPRRDRSLRTADAF